MRLLWLMINDSSDLGSYGEALVRALLERARHEPFARVSLNVDNSNVPAVSLYLKLGFRDATRPPDEPESQASRYMDRLL